jgi:hypothetical protein
MYVCVCARACMRVCTVVYCFCSVISLSLNRCSIAPSLVQVPTGRQKFCFVLFFFLFRNSDEVLIFSPIFVFLLFHARLGTVHSYCVALFRYVILYVFYDENKLKSESR